MFLCRLIKSFSSVEALKILRNTMSLQTNGMIEHEKKSISLQKQCDPLSQSSNEHIFSIREVVTIIQFCGFCLHVHTQNSIIQNINPVFYTGIIFCVNVWTSLDLLQSKL